jgi:hypothetical protein
MDPTTIPAMAPPDSPISAAGVDVADELADDEGKSVPMAVVMGKTTPLQRVSVPANRQQESVAFWEELAQ